MSVIIRRRKSVAAFTLVETLLATLIAVYVVAAAWSIYVITSMWWHNISPEIEAERVARSAVLSVIGGTVDSTAGTDVVGINSYTRRNGIAWAFFDPDHIPPNTPVISEDRRTIDFRLEADSANSRRFYMAVDPVTGLNAVYYRNNLNQSQLIKPTLGITDLQFYFYTVGAETNYNMIKVVANVEKDILGTRKEPKHIKIQYSDYAYLKNSL
ncbi:MAG: hypothetical protein JXB40_03320 [Candidatus Omnitrophica bacterium]|nr:hypothetical protein [Candidatus Omnitrophota bacterium]